MEKIFLKKPKDFHPSVNSAGCLIEVEGEILLVKRGTDSDHSHTWAMPGGTVEPNETELAAVARELEEETGLGLIPEKFEFVTIVYGKYDEFDFTFHVFHVKLNEKFEVKLRPNEHTDYKWTKPLDALGQDNIPGLDECIKIVYKKL